MVEKNYFLNSGPSNDFPEVSINLKLNIFTWSSTYPKSKLNATIVQKNEWIGRWTKFTEKKIWKSWESNYMSFNDLQCVFCFLLKNVNNTLPSILGYMESLLNNLKLKEKRRVQLKFTPLTITNSCNFGYSYVQYN